MRARTPVVDAQYAATADCVWMRTSPSRRQGSVGHGCSSASSIELPWVTLAESDRQHVRPSPRATAVRPSTSRGRPLLWPGRCYPTALWTAVTLGECHPRFSHRKDIQNHALRTCLIVVRSKRSWPSPIS